MKDRKTKPIVGRRDFLRALGSGAGAATAAALARDGAKADTENNDEKRKAATRKPTT